MAKMLVVNLFGAPGAGKSTGAAYVFSQLKMAGVNAELVTEFAKDKVWEESTEVFKNQAYIFGKQYFRISRLNDKVDVVVTDSPILLSSFYSKHDPLKTELDVLVTKAFNLYENFNVFIERTKPYNPKGRFQNEQESDELANELLSFLQEHDVSFECYDGSIEGYDAIVSNVLNELNLR